MTDKLVEKCLLTEEKLQSDEFDGLKFDCDDIKYVLEAQLTKAIPIIAEEIKRELEKIAELEMCDPDTMPYFSSHYAIVADEWDKFWERYLVANK